MTFTTCLPTFAHSNYQPPLSSNLTALPTLQHHIRRMISAIREYDLVYSWNFSCAINCSHFWHMTSRVLSKLKSLVGPRFSDFGRLVSRFAQNCSTFPHSLPLKSMRQSFIADLKGWCLWPIAVVVYGKVVWHFDARLTFYGPLPVDLTFEGDYEQVPCLNPIVFYSF